MAEKKEFVWEAYGLSVEKAAKMAGLLTWFIDKVSEEGIKESELISKTYELLKRHGFTEREIVFGMYITGKYALAITTVTRDPAAPLAWFSEVVNASSDLDENLSRYMKKFKEAVATKSDIERDVV